MNRKDRRAAAKTNKHTASLGRRRPAAAGTMVMSPQFAEAARYYQAGRLQEAHRICQQILSADRNEINALQLDSIIALQTGRPDVAIQMLGIALTANEGIPALHGMMGEALQAVGQLDEATDSYRRAVTLAPNSAPIHANLGNAFLQRGMLEEAVAAYQRALGLDPRSAATHNNLGNALTQLGRFDEAIAAYGCALAADPTYATAHNNLGDVFRARHEFGRATECYRQALTIEPDYALAHCNLGIALTDQGSPDEAIVSLRRAISIAPTFVAAHVNLGNALRAVFTQARYEEALASYDRAVALKADSIEALSNRAEVLRELGRYEESARDYAQVLSIDPANDLARGGMLTIGVLTCAWDSYAENVRGVTESIVAAKHTIAPFIFLYISGSPTDQLRCAEAYVRSEHIRRSPLWTGERYSHPKIKVAYLSGDLYNHATAYLMAGLFEAHDRSRFETTAVSFGPDLHDEMTARLGTAFDRFLHIGSNGDRDVALLLKKLEIDIAVDLKGYTRGARPGVLAYRPAPIQVNFLGYPGTMAVDHIDYILADRVVIPEDQQMLFNEKVVYLPDSYQPNDAARRIGERTLARSEAGLPENGFVFCSFNNSGKITPQIFDIWIRLLRRVHGSVLWLLEDNVAAVQNLRHEAIRRDIAANRLIFAPRVKSEDHLARQRLADLMLDTLPYNAHTTASDALWAGVPIVTCAGSSFAGRVAASLLHAVGLPELVAGSLEEYEALALEFAEHQAALAAIKAKLATNRETYPSLILIASPETWNVPIS